MRRHWEPLPDPHTTITPHPQDVVAGDGTTSVTVIAGALLRKSLELLEKGVHPTIISDAFHKAALKACEVSGHSPCFDCGFSGCRWVVKKGYLLGCARRRPRPARWASAQQAVMAKRGGRCTGCF